MKDTEKSSLLLKNNTYVFLLNGFATKSILKSHIENSLNVQVSSIRSLKKLIKKKKFKNSFSKKSIIRKIYVTLKKGFSINKENK